MCWAAKWLGEKKVKFSSIHQATRADMIDEIYDLLEEADAVVHWNGTKFDIPTLNSEFLADRLDPPSSYAEIDLLKTARQRFRLPSNKLDYVARYLEMDGKIKHMGMQLWHDCMANDKKAWRLMKRYNKRDVTLLEDIYHVLLPWIRNHPNMGHFVDTSDISCAKCGSKEVIKNGREIRTIVPYQRYKCIDCGSPLKGRLAIAGHRPTTRAA